MVERIGEQYHKLRDRTSDEETGLVVEVKIERLDRNAVGKWIASMMDVDQAGVIDGLATALYSHGFGGDMQIAYLVDELRKSPNQADIERFITALHATWKEG